MRIYCHFSFKRPKDKDYGIFAVAYYADELGKKLIKKEVNKRELWADQQFISAIQAYNNCLDSIFKNQANMMKAGIDQVILVTDNSTLCKWILKPDKNKDYAEYMERAVHRYRVGGANEIKMSVGLYKALDYEKSYKFCKEQNIVEDKRVIKCGSHYKLDIGSDYKSVLDIVKSDENVPEVEKIS